MRRKCGYASRAAALFLLAVTASSTHAEVTTEDIGGIAPSSTRPATCPSRSINYITHSLPQQCLTTSWASKPNTQQASAQDGKHTADGLVHNPEGTGDATATNTIPRVNPELLSSNTSTLLSANADSESQVVRSNATPSTTAKQPEAVNEAEQGMEIDSPLDNANFLSFEEWKRQNLAKAGQSAENLGARAGNGGREPRRRPGGINNALDSLGEDTEIEIDFGGFVNPGKSAYDASSAEASVESDNFVEKDRHREGKTLEEPPGVRRRSKDAGKTCKERSNYASFDCAATVLKTNKECQGSNAVLVENKDSYMLNICSAKNKFFILELCDDILIDTVVLANFEFFSSMFRTFRVSVSDRYPVKLDKWKVLGTFEARNSRDVQAFLIENPLIWARYLRVEILTHFGNEYYCPVSLIRVHGTTMMEEFNYDLKRSGTEEESDSEAGESEGGAIDATSDVVSAAVLEEQAMESTKPDEETSTQLPETTTARSVEVPTDTSFLVQDTAAPSDSDCGADLGGFTPYKTSISRSLEELFVISDGVPNVCVLEDQPVNTEAVLPVSSQSYQSTTAVEAVKISITPIANQTFSSHIAVPTSANSTHVPSSSAAVRQIEPNSSSSQNDSEPARPANQTSIGTAKVQISSTQPPTATPTTQESFFKSVHKRLQLLESNSTLSLQYIEEQSRILRDAFSKVEKRQLAKTTTFLETLNTTVLTELRDFRNQYDQIWQSTVLELSSQREQSQHEVSALSARLSLLADEIVFQKRMVILQFILILLCLGLVIFSRQSSLATYLDLPPVVQDAINKSSANLSRYTPHFETPPASPPSTRPPSRYGLLRKLTHRGSPSDGSQSSRARDDVKSANIAYSPPTPTSEDSPDSNGCRNAKAETDEDSSDAGLEAGANAIRQRRSSSVTPSRRRGN